MRGAGHRMLGLGQRQSQHSQRLDGRKTYSTGYEYLHVMIDDYSRVAYAELLDDLTAACAVTFLRRAVAWHLLSERVQVRGGDEQTTGRAMSPTTTPQRYTSSALNTTAPGLIGREPTAKPSG